LFRRVFAILADSVKSQNALEQRSAGAAGDLAADLIEAAPERLLPDGRMDVS
jgi:hypothetical protein